MKIKDKIQTYYHLLYRSLKIGDKRLHEGSESDLVEIINEDIVRLDAFLSLLLYVDHTLPVIRCQKAFSKLKIELEGLYYLFKEKKILINKSKTLEDHSYVSLISQEIEKLSTKFKSSTHDLYFNTIHATEKLLFKHLALSSEVKIKVGILAYFINSLDEIKCKNIDTEFMEAGYLSRGLLANLEFMTYVADNSRNTHNKKFYRAVQEFVHRSKEIHLYDRTIKAISLDSNVDSDLLESLKKEMASQMVLLTSSFSQMINHEENIIHFIKNVIGNESNTEHRDVNESIQARNVLYEMK